LSTIAKPGDSFLIVVEGKVTEVVYLELLRHHLQLAAAFIKITPGDAPDPKAVIQTAARHAREQIRKHRKQQSSFSEPTRFDHVWAVIDADVPARENNWHQLVALARKENVRLVPSMPSFEFWLLLHFGFNTRGDLPDGASAKAAVKKITGMDSDNHASAQQHMPSLLQHWQQAAQHAEAVRQHHLAAGSPTPANPSTEVDILARAMNAAAPAHLQG
jgi:hypothetical protein